MKMVRTRFAPSPTGFQHIGGFRTALYAWLLARKHGGEFIFRVEDTDQERVVEGAVEYLIESMKWLGMDYDQGPINQSSRLEFYQSEVQKLIDSGKAYRCDCTPERLEQERLEQKARRERPGYSGYCRTRNVSADVPHVVRFRLPDRIQLTLNDAVRGKIVWDDPPLRDPVILKSDGFPTYHLASVVDDNDMGVSHILRGEEWIPTTPIHLLLYEAFGYEKPVFAHLSHILGPDGKKLSKRHGAVSLDEYKNSGILPEALMNYVVLIGWSPGAGNDQEVFAIDDLIKEFSLDGLNSSSGVFDQNKLEWMNGVYIRSLSLEDFAAKIPEVIEKIDPQAWEILAPHVQERVKNFNELEPMLEFLWVEDLKPDLDAIKDPAEAQDVFRHAYESLKELEDFSTANIKSCLEQLVEVLGLKMGKVLVPIRIAVTGKKATPPLFESIEALGKARTLERLLAIQDTTNANAT